jgi:hypothetical protein
MPNKPQTEEKGRPEREARERHHGVGRAGMRQTDRPLPTQVDNHEGVGAEGAENSAVTKIQFHGNTRCGGQVEGRLK